MINVLIEGWINIPHSYCIVNLYQILALNKIPNLQLYLQDVPVYNESWIDKNEIGELLLSTGEQNIINNLPRYSNNCTIDLIYRISFKYDISHPKLSPVPPVLLFYTSEFKVIPDDSFCFGHRSVKNVTLEDLYDKIKLGSFYCTTPSNWSACGLLKYQPIVIPHGVDTSKYYLDFSKREYTRLKYNIPADAFVYLNVGAMTGNKGIKTLIKTFYKVIVSSDDDTSPFLVLKGLEQLYKSQDLISTYLKELVAENSIVWKTVKNKLIYIPDTLHYNDMRDLFNACDCYVSPYIAEGFNIPVLDAVACGLPVIVTKHGPTDDFTNSTFALYPDTIQVKTTIGQHLLLIDEISLLDKMIRVINDTEFRHIAAKSGPKFVSENYTWDIVAEKLMVVFTNITSQNNV